MDGPEGNREMIELANMAANKGDLDKLVKLSGQGIFPNEHGIQLAVQYNRFEVILFLARHEIFPTSQMADTAALNGYLPIVRYLKFYNILPTQRGINLAVVANQVKIVEFLLECNLYPEPHIFPIIKQHNHTDMLTLLYNFVD